VRHAMTRYVFEEVAYPARKRVKCYGCGKALVRSTTFTATVNPWNVNADGEPRTRAEIVEVLRGKASAWMTEPAECTPCLRKRRR
jgi:ribosomal protein S27E